MATVSNRPPQVNREESQRRVRGPLDQLRGYIRLYVSLEGLSVLLIYLAVWFWMGLLLDYGLFKAFGLDWVQVLSHGFRGGLLAVLTTGLLAVVTVKMLLRLLREFRASSLALVLERRFPGQLGDRLITAVELADKGKASRYGFSLAMIDHTIHEAAERVGQVPVSEVFNWKRLVRYGVAVGVLSVGLYVLAAAGYLTVQGIRGPDASGRQAGLGEYVQRFNQVAETWFERNILLRDVIWPRRAYVVVLDFPEEEKKIGLDAPPLTLNVRALKYVVADTDRRKAPEGWRSLTWSDLTKFFPGAVPALPAKLTPKNARTSGEALVDEIDLLMNKEENRRLPQTEELRGFFSRLDEKAEAFQMSRRLRKLVVPEVVTVIYKGQTLGSEQTLQKQEDNKYTCTLPELKESVRFWVRGEDYYTPAKKIEVVPPPAIETDQLIVVEEQPAYLYYRPSNMGNLPELRGKKQKLRGRPISLTGDVSRVDVPAGSDLLVTARTTKPLQMPGGARAKPLQGIDKLDVEQPDSYTFQARFRNVVAPIDVIFEFTDTDAVLGQRRVLIKPIDDAVPEVDVQIEVVRKTNAGYLVTPSARIPFSGKIKDANGGLSSATYAYSLAVIEAQPGAATRSAQVLQVLPFGAGGVLPVFGGLGTLSLLTKRGDDLDRPPVHVPLVTFPRALNEKRGLPVAEIVRRLAQEPPPPDEVAGMLLREHELSLESEYFDVAALGLKSTDDKAPPKRYRMRLGVTATDSNVESGPGIGQSKEKFTVLIVSENELLTEIAKEESGLHVKLGDSVNKLKEARLKLERVITDLPTLKEDELKSVSRWSVDSGEVADAVNKASDTAREILVDYRRILAELKANKVRLEIVERVNNKICEPLDQVGREDFPRTEESARTLKENLVNKKRDIKGAQQALGNLNRLLDRLRDVLDSMEQLEDINKLIAMLVAIEKEETQQLGVMEQLRNKLTEDIFKALGGLDEDDKPKKDKKDK